MLDVLHAYLVGGRQDVRDVQPVKDGVQEPVAVNGGEDIVNQDGAAHGKGIAEAALEDQREAC